MASQEFIDLVESGIKIGNKAKHIILYSHVDMDGLASCMVAYRQLLKQGFKPSDITLKPLQYGSNHPEMMKLKKGQHGVVVDYGDFDEKVFKDAGFTISDHHESKGGHGIGKDYLTGKIVQKDLTNKWGDRIEDKGTTEVHSKNAMRHGSERDPKRIAQMKDIHRSDTERLATLHTTNLIDPTFLRDLSQVDSAKFQDLADVVDLPISKETLPSVMNVLITKFIKPDTDTGNKGSRSTGGFEWLVRNAKPTTVGLWNALRSEELKKVVGSEVELAQELAKKPADRDNNKIHSLMGNVSKGTARKVMHGSNAGELNKLKELLARVSGKEWIDRKYNPDTGNQDYKGVAKELSDLADNNQYNKAFKNAINDFQLNARLRGPASKKSIDTLKRLIQQKITEKSFEKDNGRTSEKNMIDKAGPKAEIEKQKENELARMKDASNIETTNFKALNKSVVKGDFSAKEDDEAEEGKKFEKYSKGQPNRYAGSILTSPHDKKRYPISIRRWSQMIQFAANPDMSAEDKEKLNLVVAAKKAISDARIEFGDKIKKKIKDYFSAMDYIHRVTPGGVGKNYVKELDKKNKAIANYPEEARLSDNYVNKVFKTAFESYEKDAVRMVDFGFKKMLEQTGGHKPIATVQNFNLATLPPDPIRQELKDVKAIESRVKAMKAKGYDTKALEEKVAKMKAYPEFVKETFSTLQKELIDYIEKHMVKYVEDLGLSRVDKPIRGQERFVMRKGEAIEKVPKKKQEEKTEEPKEAPVAKEEPKKETSADKLNKLIKEPIKKESSFNWDKFFDDKEKKTGVKISPEQRKKIISAKAPSKKIDFTKKVMKNLKGEC